MNIAKSRRLRPTIGIPIHREDMEDDRSSDNDPPSKYLKPSDEYEKAEMYAALADCLERVSKKLYKIYELIYVEEMRYTNAARILGCSEAYVRQKLAPRLKEAIQRCMSTKGFVETCGKPE